MNRMICAGILSSLMLLTACGGSSSSDNAENKKTLSGPTNVAASSNGASINPAEAEIIINTDGANSYTVHSGEKIVVTFNRVYEINSFNLTRVNSSVTTGSKPDITIELSADNVTWKMFSAFNGCLSFKQGKTDLGCGISPFPARYARIGVHNDKAFELIGFEAIAEK